MSFQRQLFLSIHLPLHCWFKKKWSSHSCMPCQLSWLHLPDWLEVSGAQRSMLLTLPSVSCRFSCFLLTACFPTPYLCFLPSWSVVSPFFNLQSPSITQFLLLSRERQLYFYCLTCTEKLMNAKFVYPASGSYHTNVRLT